MTNENVLETLQRLTDKICNMSESCEELFGLIVENEEFHNLKKAASLKIANAKKAFDEFRLSVKNLDGQSEIKLEITKAAVREADDYIKLLQILVLKIESEVEERTEQIRSEVDKILKKKIDTSSDEWVHILHLSDLHFGCYYDDGEVSKSEKRKYERVIRNLLFKFLQDYKKDCGIDIIAITGDVSYKNNSKGYEDFADWLKELCSEKVLNIDMQKNVILCAGNHDSAYDNRKEKEILPDIEAERNTELKSRSVSKVLSMDKISERQEQFRYFNNICSKLGIAPLKNFDLSPDKEPVNFLVGERDIKGIRFVVLNTAWNSFPGKTKDGKDNGYNHGNLYLGSNLVEDLCIKKDDSKITVTLFHHPLSWLHETEIRTFGKDQELPVIKHVEVFSDIILNGHVHGKIEPPDVIANKTLVFRGGALCTNDSRIFGFEVISINKTRQYCTQKIVMYDTQIENEVDGWRIESENDQQWFHFASSRGDRELLTRICLSEITEEEAFQAAKESKREGSFQRMYQQSKLGEIYKIVSQNIKRNQDLKNQNERMEGNDKTRSREKDEK